MRNKINRCYVSAMLHTINGFLCAALGYALVDMMNREERFTFQLSPKFLALVAFCFSMTVGILWDFFEYAGDSFFALDMLPNNLKGMAKFLKVSFLCSLGVLIL